MSEFITIQVGQCGNQIGQSFWPAVVEEYGIRTAAEHISHSHLHELQSSFSSFFAIDETCRTSPPFRTVDELLHDNIKARAVLVDMENAVISRCQSSCLGKIYEEKCILRDYSGSGNNWAQGFCNFGPQYKNSLLKCVQHAAEKCDSLQGYLFMFSVCGGTGSGLGTYILQLIEDYYPHVERIVSCVYPTGTEDVTICPYNVALATKQMKEHASCVIPIENRALFNIVRNRKRLCDFKRRVTIEAEDNSFDQINNIIVKMLLHLTSGSRFAGNMNVDINEISTNMVPFPRMNFLSSSYSPIFNNSSTMLKRIASRVEKDELFMNVCNKDNQLVELDPFGRSILLATTLIGRGNYTLSDMRNYIEKLQKKNCFTNWSRKAMKIGLCDTPPTGEEISLLSLFNTTAMSSLFQYLHDTYRKVYEKKAHLHHYQKIDGFSDEYFKQCTESLLESIESYRKITM